MITLLINIELTVQKKPKKKKELVIEEVEVKMTREQKAKKKRNEEKKKEKERIEKSNSIKERMSNYNKSRDEIVFRDDFDTYTPGSIASLFVRPNSNYYRYDEDSGDLSDMEAGADEIDEENEKALKIARYEDRREALREKKAKQKKRKRTSESSSSRTSTTRKKPRLEL
eukprot:TRINITY_DN2666_c0_g1_i6.p1 TRINITY_DN2666_c0_g1~~TRINITY_DN2666_c0_g1_i6.p1  ORF type:complete len:170 (-),score=60.48 TRINITY_DN2666_c0_g1_i6:54-563(-)